MKRNAVQVIHVLPHRVHLRSAWLVGQHRACSAVAKQLAQDSKCERVSVRERTGSVVVERRAGILDPSELATRLSELVRSERDEAGRPLETRATEQHRGPTRVATAVIRAA